MAESYTKQTRLITTHKFLISLNRFAEESTLKITRMRVLSILLILLITSYMGLSYSPDNGANKVNTTLKSLDSKVPTQGKVVSGRALHTPMDGCPNGKKRDAKGVCRRSIQIH